MSRWDLICIMRERFSNEQIVDMLVRWLSADDLEECINDYLFERNLEITNGFIKDIE